MKIGWSGTKTSNEFLRESVQELAKMKNAKTNK